MRKVKVVGCKNNTVFLWDILKNYILISLYKIRLYKIKYNLNKKINFRHGKSYILPDNIILIASYHPSPRNVNTKLISLKMMTNLFKKVKKLSTT